MNINDVFPSKYIKAADLNGHDVSVTIESATIERLGEESKLLLMFTGKKKGLICNKTNADRIAHLYGLDTDGWIGKSIVLYSEMTNFGGKVTEGVRVKAPSKPARPAPPPQRVYSDADMEPSDDIPF